MLLVVSVVFAVAAGCLDGPKTAAPDLPVEGEKAPQATTLKVSYRGCREQLGLFPVTPDVVEPYLPPGFAPAPFDEGGATALIVLIAFKCMAHEVLDANETPGRQSAGTVWEVRGIVPVVAPAPYADPNATHHAVLLGTMTTSPGARTTYAAWNVTPAQDGEVRVENSLESPAARVGEAVADGSEYSGAMQTVVAGPVSEEPPGSARMFQVANDTVVGAFDLAWTAAGGMQGVAVLREPAAFPGVPASVAPGLGFHYWADAYAYTMTPVALPPSTK